MTELRQLLAQGDLSSARQALEAGASPEVGPLTDPAALALVSDAAGSLAVPGIDELVRTSIGLGRTAVVRELLRRGVSIPDQLREHARSRGHTEIVRLLETSVDTEVVASEIVLASHQHVAVLDDTLGASICFDDLLVFWELGPEAASPVHWHRLDVNRVNDLQVNRTSGMLGIGCEDEGLLLATNDGAVTRAYPEAVIGDRTGLSSIAELGDSFFEVAAHGPNDRLFAVASTADGGVTVVDGPEMRRDDYALRAKRFHSDLSEAWEWNDPEHASFNNTAVATADTTTGIIQRTDRGVRVLTILNDTSGTATGSVALDWDRGMTWREPMVALESGIVVSEGLTELRILDAQDLTTVHETHHRVLSLAGVDNRLLAGTDQGIETLAL